MSDDLTRRAERIIVDCKIEGYCGPCVVIYDLLARLQHEQAEVARLRSMLTALEQEMRKEVEWSAAPARTVIRWANRIVEIYERQLQKAGDGGPTR